MRTPYNTGRVLIGCMYTSTKAVHHDAYAYSLQSKLLDKHKHRSDNVWHKLANYIWRML